MGGGSSDEPQPDAIQDAVAVAIEDGATMDDIVERVRSRGGDRSPSIPRARRCARARSAEGRWAERTDGLICLQRETDRFAEEWERTRDPRAEGRSALIAIETLRTLALRTMVELGAREEPVPTEDLARLALVLSRIESADRLRIEREQAAADPADAHAGAAARAARMTHAERVETVRRAFEGQFFPGRTDPPPAAFGWAAASAEDSPVTLPEPAPDPPAAAPPTNSRVTPPQPNTRCRRHNHAIWSERKDTPTSPQPSPPLIHFPQAPGARSASLAFAPCGARGRRGRTGGAVYVPSPPFRGERDRERWVCCLRGAVPQNPTYPTYPT